MRDIDKHKQRKHEWYKRNKELTQKRTHDRRNKTKKWLDEYKQTISCEICGESRRYCLDFHHKDPKIKVKSISNLASQGYGIPRIQEEINKCRVLCKNCHAHEHYGQDLVE